ncbi:LacI family DNA-binding transcriptional regulator [Xylanimonas oleitrophica]|uniref:LacI family DNA-binding transcriptional regulator n=1 Tax=Xylanimonas oleitrophica TaxID=2607479 RepID=UPI001C54C7E6|nr:LacI family DNA-binding transcriptional regulator [Xylanimonas oleitrophica]
MPDRRPLLRDVAQRANASVSLVSHALNGSGRVSEETRARILKAAEELGYRSNRYARLLRTGRREDVGVVIRNMHNPMFLDVLTSLEEAARREDRALLVTNSRYDVAEQRKLLDHLLDLGVGRIVIAPVAGLTDLRAWQAEHPEVHVVALNATGGDGEGAAPGAPGLGSVNPDHRAAVGLALALVAERGHRAVDFVAAPAGLASDTVRERAFAEACAAHGIVGRVRRTPLDARAVSGFLADDLRARVLGAGVPEHPCYLFNSDYLAAVAYGVAADLGLRVGRDLSVVGHDDLPTSALLDPGLTTLAFDRTRVGVEALRLVVEAPGEHVVLPVELRVRGSVADLGAR